MTLADLITSLRIRLDDKTTSKYERLENLATQISAANKTFQVSNFPIAGADATPTLSVWIDGTLKTITTHYTVVVATGTITLTAGQAVPATSMIVSYGWQFYTDADLTDFITAALEETPYTTVPGVPDGLVPAVREYAMSMAWEGLYARHSEFFNAQAAGKGINKSEIPKNFQKQSDACRARAEDDRENYYKRQGRRNAPAYSQVQTTQNPYTPRR